MVSTIHCNALQSHYLTIDLSFPTVSTLTLVKKQTFCPPDCNPADVTILADRYFPDISW